MSTPLVLEMNPEWDKTLVTREGLGPWSYSKRKVLSNCPLKFFLQYIMKIKMPRIEDGSIPSNHIGSALHLILEELTIGRSVADAYKKAKRKHFEDVGQEYWDQYVIGNEYNCIDFRRKLDEFEVKHKVKRYLCEIRMAIGHDWQPTDFFDNNGFYRGVVDLVIQLENGDNIVLDHKSNLGAGDFVSIKYFREQLETYKPLIHFGLMPITGAQSGVHFISNGQVILDDYHDKDQIEGKLRKMMVYQVDNAVQAVKEAGYFKKEACSACKWCDYRVQCKSRGKETIEGKTVKEWEDLSRELFIPVTSV